MISLQAGDARNVTVKLGPQLGVVGVERHVGIEPATLPGTEVLVRTCSDFGR